MGMAERPKNSSSVDSLSGFGHQLENLPSGHSLSSFLTNLLPDKSFRSCQESDLQSAIDDTQSCTINDLSLGVNSQNDEIIRNLDNLSVSQSNCDNHLPTSNTQEINVTSCWNGSSDATHGAQNVPGLWLIRDSSIVNSAENGFAAFSSSTELSTKINGTSEETIGQSDKKTPDESTVLPFCENSTGCETESLLSFSSDGLSDLWKNINSQVDVAGVDSCVLPQISSCESDSSNSCDRNISCSRGATSLHKVRNTNKRKVAVTRKANKEEEMILYTSQQPTLDLFKTFSIIPPEELWNKNKLSTIKNHFDFLGFDDCHVSKKKLMKLKKTIRNNLLKSNVIYTGVNSSRPCRRVIRKRHFDELGELSEDSVSPPPKNRNMARIAVAFKDAFGSLSAMNDSNENLRDNMSTKELLSHISENYDRCQRSSSALRAIRRNNVCTPKDYGMLKTICSQDKHIVLNRPKPNFEHFSVRSNRLEDVIKKQSEQENKIKQKYKTKSNTEDKNLQHFPAPGFAPKASVQKLISGNVFKAKSISPLRNAFELSDRFSSYSLNHRSVSSQLSGLSSVNTLASYHNNRTEAHPVTNNNRFLANLYEDENSFEELPSLDVVPSQDKFFTSQEKSPIENLSTQYKSQSFGAEQEINSGSDAELVGFSPCRPVTSSLACFDECTSTSVSKLNSVQITKTPKSFVPVPSVEVFWKSSAANISKEKPSGSFITNNLDRAEQEMNDKAAGNATSHLTRSEQVPRTAAPDDEVITLDSDDDDLEVISEKITTRPRSLLRLTLLVPEKLGNKSMKNLTDEFKIVKKNSVGETEEVNLESLLKNRDLNGKVFLIPKKT